VLFRSYTWSGKLKKNISRGVNCMEFFTNIEVPKTAKSFREFYNH